MEAPKSFRDPYYAQLSGDVEKRLELPVGMLQSIITHGERSNADQVSEAGARTVAQIIPATRKAALEKYGIDAYLSPENALEVAGRLLKDSLKRNGGDPLQAVGEYIGGTNRENWGKTTAAYIDRVATGMQAAKTTALGSDFAKWMADHPATPAATAPGAAPPAANDKPDALAAGFGQWLKSKVGADAIPGQSVQAPPTDHAVATPGAPDPTLGQTIVGTGEAALNAVTSATGGAAGMVVGALGGLARSAMDGTYGTPEGVQTVEQNAARGAQALTYEPRTESGRSQAEALGSAMQNVVPLAGLTPHMSAMGTLASPAAAAISPIARQALQATKQGAAKVAEAVTPARAAPVIPTPGTMGSVGAAGTDIATMRRANAQELPVPIELTKGQATRDYAQQRFERETAKDAERGGALRERFDDHNEALLKNFDHLVDTTGAEAPNLRAVGAAVDEALKKQMQRDRVQVKVAYKAAEKAGEMEEPVALNKVVDHLNESAPDAATAPLLDVARRRAIRLGLAAEGGDGNLVAQPVPLKIAETFRQAIGGATDFQPTNIRQATIIKGLVDEATEGMGGDLYKQARATKARFSQNYTNRALIADLVSNKRGMADRKVALEDVFDHSIMRGSLDDVRNLRRVLHRSGDEGLQAWRELQGQTMRYIRDQAVSNISIDARGNTVVSAAKLDKAVKALDADGRLDFIFSKRGSAQLRLLNDVAKDVLTSPPGAVNTSNTASVLAGLFDVAITAASGGTPLPIASGLRLVVNNIKDRRLRLRVNEALGITKKEAPTQRPRKETVH